VSRALAALAVLALAAAISLSPLGPVGADSRAAAADCVWQRHSKRVVKQLKRHGKPQRLVRIKRWWSCNPPATSPAIATPPPIPAALDPAPEPESGAARLSVKAAEFSYTLSRPSIVAGEAIVELNNQGEDPHNLNLELQGGGAPLEVSEAGPLEHRTAHFDLAAGSYRLWCSLPEHEEKGMKATLLVE
jgi:hypothetical protein